MEPEEYYRLAFFTQALRGGAEENIHTVPSVCIIPSVCSPSWDVALQTVVVQCINKCGYCKVRHEVTLAWQPQAGREE